MARECPALEAREGYPAPFQDIIRMSENGEAELVPTGSFTIPTDYSAKLRCKINEVTGITDSVAYGVTAAYLATVCSINGPCSLKGPEAEQVEGIPPHLLEVDVFLRDHGAVGFLIGGQAAVLASGGNGEEAKERKDCDLLIVDSGSIVNGETPYDAFIRRNDDEPYTNENGSELPYHVHYVGKEQLQPGLHFLPPKAVYMTEVEMQRRRLTDRRIAAVGYTNRIEHVDTGDIILEFTGDMSWLKMIRYPVKIMHCGSSTFIYLAEAQELFMPEAVLLNLKEERAPEIRQTNTDIEEIRDNTVVKSAHSLLDAGHYGAGLGLLLRKDPKLADSDLVLMKLMRRSQQEIKRASALATWLEVAARYNFNTIKLRSKVAYEFGIKVQEDHEDLTKEINYLLKLLADLNYLCVDVILRLTHYGLDKPFSYTTEELVEEFSDRFPDHEYMLALLADKAVRIAKGNNNFYPGSTTILSDHRFWQPQNFQKIYNLSDADLESLKRRIESKLSTLEECEEAMGWVKGLLDTCPHR